MEYQLSQRHNRQRNEIDEVMKNIIFYRRIWLFAVAGLLLHVGDTVASVESSTPYREINKSFPDSLHVEANDQRTIEFCPDNTCDLFVGTKRIPSEKLMDFAYIFIYYFSDYYVLEEWRGRDEPLQIARKILEKPLYKLCKKDLDKETARCVLRRLSQQAQIKLYEVRHDEKARRIKRVKIP